MIKPRKNLPLRNYILGQGITYQEVARKMYMSNASFSAMLQRNLTESQVAEIKHATDEIVSSRGDV